MKKVLNIIKLTMVWLLVALAVFMMVFTVISVTTFNRNDRALFGYKAYIVNSDSMAATDFAAGDLIFVREVSAEQLNEGDIITFISQASESYGEVVTHKIRTSASDAQGNPGFITYGTTTGADDPVIVTHPFILGRYEFHLDGVGTFFNFLKTPQGYIVCIFVPFMLLILYQGISCICLFRRYKKEQNEALEAEKARIDEERRETNRMMKELMALKAQLEQSEEQPVAAGGKTEGPK